MSTTTQPPPLILDLRNRSPPSSPPSRPVADGPDSSSRASSQDMSPSHSSDASGSTGGTSVADPLRDQIVAGLRGRKEPVVPGKTDADRSFSYRRTIPTMTLYSQRGLEIYEDITNTQVRPCSSSSQARQPAELQLTSEPHPACRPTTRSRPRRRSSRSTATRSPAGCSASRRASSPATTTATASATTSRAARATRAPTRRSGASRSLHAPLRPGRKKLTRGEPFRARRGDSKVGEFNFGVNGSVAAASSPSAKYGLAVELGSGSLDKTRHLLRSMAKLLQAQGGSKSAPMEAIDYKAVRPRPSCSSSCS